MRQETEAWETVSISYPLNKDVFYLNILSFLACDYGWSYFEETNRCYKYFYNDYKWSTASQSCNLAKVPSRSTNDFLKQLLGGRTAWIDGVCDHYVGENDKCQRWKWSDGQTISQFFWIQNEPSWEGIRIELTSGGWNAEDGGNDNGHICEVVSNF